MKLPKGRRLVRSAEFAHVRQKGRTWKGHFLLLGVLTDPAVPTFKLGLVTSRKLGNAVVRNRTRRRLRAVVQQTGERLMPGLRLVIVARPSAAKASSDRLLKEWKWLLHQAGLIAPSEPAPTPDADLNPNPNPAPES